MASNEEKDQLPEVMRQRVVVSIQSLDDPSFHVRRDITLVQPFEEVEAEEQFLEFADELTEAYFEFVQMAGVYVPRTNLN